ncbi:MAG TPA: type II CAAX endopeptidase family protein [Candidatus Polarisedimenticolaceae bacterium]|nr:type II CAAX endopeptidase family protein [Candidatus Polarisedimenticolaceae bacterium]
MTLRPDDPRLRAALALFEAVVAVSLTMLLAILVTYLVAPGAVVKIAELAGEAVPPGLTTGHEPSMREALAWTFALQNGVLVAAGAALAWWRCPRPKERTPLVRALSWGLLAGVAAFALSGLVAWLQEVAGVPVHEQEPLLRAIKEIPMAQAFPWVAVIAPLGEEVFFRGYLFRFLDSRTPRWLAYAASACAFAGIHLNPSGFLVYVSIALVLAMAYRRTGTLLVPVLAHGVHNAITLLVLYASPVA